jgi:TPP-dependent pyruvate/acetoin dehydrogenase alpha subunit
MEQIDAESARVRAPPPLKYDDSAKSKERCIGVEQYDSNKDPLARFNSKYKSPTETKDEMKKVREEINERASRKAERAAVRSAPRPSQESKPVPAKTTDMWGNLGQ